MISHNWPSLRFLISDLGGISASFALFSLLAFFPGYATGWLTDLFGFRARILPFRLAASVPLSLAIVPITGYTAGKWFGLSAVWFIYAGLGAAFVAGALRRSARHAERMPFAALWPFGGLIAVWLAIAFFSLADLPAGHRLYFSVIDFDYSVRIAFTHSIAAFGLPARNPFFFPGHAVALRYHYFWMIVCAQVCRLGMPLLDARQAFIAGTMWAGIGLISLIPLYLRLFCATSQDLPRRSRIGIALLAVTGLDILPALLMVWLNRVGLVSGISPSVEWWNEQIDGWLYTMLWEPHYVCALVACLTGFLILWSVQPDAARPRRIVAGVVAGMAFASAGGCGIYVAMVFAVFVGLWLVVTVVREGLRRAEAPAIAGIVAIILFRPFLAGLTAGSSGAGAPPMLQFTVRPFVPVELLLRFAGLNQLWQRFAADLLLLPLNYFLELGIFFFVGRMVWVRYRERKLPATPAELAGFLMVGVSVAICTFVKSSVIANNDLGWRGFLPAQFMLLLWAANALAERSFVTRPVRILLFLGLAGVVYDLAILRFYPLLSDRGEVPEIAWLGGDRSVGLRTLANREAYEWIRARTPETAIVQQNPGPVFQDTYYGAYGLRQTVALGGDCAMGFGGNSDSRLSPGETGCAQLLPVLSGLFAAGGPEVLKNVCGSLPIDMVIAKDSDAVWRDRASWVWTGSPVFHNDFARVFKCR